MASTAVAQDTAVNYSMSGKATLGSDYTMSGTPGQVIIPAGSNVGTVTLSAIVDNVKEKKAETAIMTLQSGSGYNFGSTGGKKTKKTKAPSATVTISD